jgi:hypothetical protein
LVGDFAGRKAPDAAPTEDEIEFIHI